MLHFKSQTENKSWYALGRGSIVIERTATQVFSGLGAVSVFLSSSTLCNRHFKVIKVNLFQKRFNNDDKFKASKQ